MELEKMRRVLAYAIEMPDTLNLPLSTVEAPIWGAYDGWNVYANTLQGSICVVWEPDIRWDQCGMVIEAMLEKGWTLITKSIAVDNTWSCWERIDKDTGDNHWWSCYQPTFTESVCCAAAAVLDGHALIDDYERMKQ